MDKQIGLFKSGVHNLNDPEIIPNDAAQDALGYVTQDGKTILVGGREALGAEGVVGKITMLHIGYKTNGDKVIFAKFGTEIKYWNGTAWVTVITGLGENTDYSAANYSSLAGAFVFINGAEGYYKIVTANPASAINIYDASKNFKGKIIIDKARTLLWNRAEDKTGIYGSKIDPQNSTVYTTVSGEVLGAAGPTIFSGTLAFKGLTKRNCFGVSISGTTGAGVETFTDSYTGVLTGNLGGTGTINYATGAYSVTFNGPVTVGNVTANYQWEDSTIGGIADFSHGSPRLAAEGFQFPQDEGGDAIQNVIVSIDGTYFSLKSNSVYQLALSDDDTTGTNLVYRKDIGIPTYRAAVSTTQGIVFLNTANPTKPEMTILQKMPVGDVVTPIVMFQHFKFSDYLYDDCAMSTFDRWILVQCRTSESSVNNRLLLCNVATKTVDVVKYSGRIAVKDGDDLYIGDSIQKTVYKIFSGFDDMGLSIENYWISKDELYGSESLKKYRRLQFKGKISIDQLVGVYVSYDDAGFQQIGSIWGGAPYVNISNPQNIGGPLIGVSLIGGDQSTTANPYFMEIKTRVPKFRKRTIKLIAENIGYFDFDSIIDHDILVFEQRMPKAFRQKQNISLDGKTNNLPNPI